MVSDPIADMLTRIRNACSREKATVEVPYSKLRVNVLETMKREGYIKDIQINEIDKAKKSINVELKYLKGEPVIQEMKRISKPGRRVFSPIQDLPLHYNGLGTYILSTSKGILSDQEAREKNIGGEVLCNLF